MKLRMISVVTLLCMSLPVSADDQDIIDYRQHVMKTIDEQVSILKMIAQSKAPADDVATQAKVLAVAASTAKLAFQTNVAGGRSKLVIWTQWPDFSKRLDALVAATDELAKSARPGDAAGLAKKVEALPCKGCHDEYHVSQ